MRHPTMTHLLLSGSILFFGGCDTPQEAPTERVRQSALIEPGDLLLTRQSAPGTEIFATPEPVREGIDPYRVLRLQDPPDLPGIEDGMRVLDVQWAGGGGENLVVLGADRVLRLHTQEGVNVLDEEVLGPLSVSSNKIAYVYGEPPDVFVRVYDLTRRTHVEVDQLSPAWSPALSEDGEEVIFVASHQGRGHFFVRRATGELETIPTGLRTPSSPTAPIWRDGDLFFEDERGVVHLDLETASIEAEYTGAKLLPHDGSPRIQILEDGKPREIATWTQGGRR